ncbi:DUF4304 domain-containing protein [Actinomadura nitritigenes]|uniref:DUF4304 domain-containing protein n=1 Tax=Actinomadura nitritigenes TaxID=134602 RepID=A0ABS3QVJ1_9ACTN|nr:DUF4304 domain-containing protein [Actinomadura nitritigenes]MBO2437995.1 DUF4304 domain-containing protein [Actinomadura nitritigenes]
MLDLDGVVRGLMRDVGTALRPMGWRGSGGLWRLVTAEGVAVVQKQGSQGSSWDARLFYLNTSVVPRAWWEWNHGADRPIEKARDVHGIRLLEGRARSADDAHRWRVTDGTDVDRLRTDLLAAVTHAAGRAAELLEPGRYVDELSALPDKQVGDWHALVVLLADRGTTPELRAACVGLRRACAGRPRAAGFIDDLIERALNRPSP